MSRVSKLSFSFRIQLKTERGGKEKDHIRREVRAGQVTKIKLGGGGGQTEKCIVKINVE